MSNPSLNRQVSMLREMMCLFTCHSGNITNCEFSKALDHLNEALHTRAAGIYWCDNGKLMMLGCSPEDFILDQVTEAQITNERCFDQLIDGQDSSISWAAFPMRAEGITRGKLWVINPSNRILTDDERELLTLTANQIALAQQNTLLCKRLAILADRRGELLRRLIQTDEQCSQRISRELHDEISQSLTALIFEVDTVLTTSLNDAAAVEHRLNHLRQKLVQVTDEVNRIVLDLRPTLLENNGLMAALGWYGTERLRPYGTQFHVSGGKCVPKLSTCITTMLYRIGQEALSNIARHASAQNAWLDVSCQNNTLALTIRDDGCGFNAAQVLGRPHGLEGIGLMGMQERATLVDGTLAFESNPGQGTSIQVKVPLSSNGIADEY